MAQAADRLLLDLAHAFARQVEFLADLLEGHLRRPDTEEILDDVAFTFRKGLERTVDLGRKRLVDQPPVGIGRIGVHQHVEQRVVLAVGERGIDRDVAAGDTQRVGDLLLGEFNSVASSSGDGVRSCSCSKRANALLILLSDPTWLSGRRTMRDCSAKA